MGVLCRFSREDDTEDNGEGGVDEMLMAVRHVYAPNCDDSDFFSNISSLITLY